MRLFHVVTVFCLVLSHDLPFSSLSDSGDLFLTPSSGSMLGGYEVDITGPCFEAASSVDVLIVETSTTFPCAKKSGSTRSVVCVMPTMFQVGPVTVSIVVDGRQWNYTGVFTLGEFFRHACMPDDWLACWLAGWLAGRERYIQSSNVHKYKCVQIMSHLRGSQ